jgi:hypothetical protein
VDHSADLPVPVFQRSVYAVNPHTVGAVQPCGRVELQDGLIQGVGEETETVVDSPVIEVVMLGMFQERGVCPDHLSGPGGAMEEGTHQLSSIKRPLPSELGGPVLKPGWVDLGCGYSSKGHNAGYGLF